MNPVYSILHTVCCFCLFQYVFSGESEWTEQRIKQLQDLKDIALKNPGFVKSPTEARKMGSVPFS